MTLSSDLVVASVPEVPLGDRELVQRAKRGNRAAGEELAQRFRQPAYLLALQLLGNPDDALDVAQDSMLSFFTTLHRSNDNRPVKPWLLTIVRNRARDLMRRRRVRRTVPAGTGPVTRPPSSARVVTVQPRSMRRSGSPW